MTMADLIKTGATREAMVACLTSLCWRPDVECYYFGVASHGGHCLIGPDPAICGSHGRIALARALGRADIDGGLCWSVSHQAEGRALLTQGLGWTAVAFWDRSGDSRPNSNTAFIVRGTLAFEQVVRVARHRWPQIWQRFTFPVVQVDKQGRRVGGGVDANS